MRSSVTRTLRIEEELDRSIQRIAADENLTVNSVVNRTLLRMVEWDHPGMKVGLVSASSTLLGRLLSDKDEEACEELGRWAAREFYVPFIAFLFGEVSVANSLDFFARASRYGEFTFGETGDSGKHILILKQTFGQNWTYYFSGVMGELFHGVLGKRFTTECTADMLVAKLEL
jgi:hypothetical protein